MPHSTTARRALLVFAFAFAAAGIPAAWADDGSGAVSAQDLARSVLQVRTAAYEPFDKFWKMDSYGSAVYLGNGLAVTNAHVVAGEDGKPTGAYVVCWSADWRKAPDACVPALLMRFDEAHDLAVLALDLRALPADKAAPRAAALAAEPAQVGDPVLMVGWPRNGGTTVTVTEGKVSGQEEDSGFLKLDANVDAGNSGGGVFSPAGDVVGLTEAASVGYSTLAIAVPAHLAAQAAKEARAATGALEPEGARRYLKGVTAALAAAASGSLDTPLLRLRKFDAFGFRLERSVETDDGAAAYYSFVDARSGGARVALLATSGGGKTQPWIARSTKEGLAKNFQSAALARGVRLGDRKTESFFLAARPRSADADPDLVVAMGDFGKLGFVVSGSRKDPDAFRRALALVGAAVRKDAPEWAEVRPAEGLRTKLPEGWTYRHVLDGDGLTRAVSATVDGREVKGGVGVASMPAASYPDVGAYVEQYVKNLSDEGGQAAWAGVLSGSENGTPFIRVASRSGKSWGQASLFVWDAGDGRLTVAYSSFESDDLSAARRAADLFAAGTLQSRPFGFPLGDVKVGANLAPAPDAR